MRLTVSLQAVPQTIIQQTSKLYLQYIRSDDRENVPPAMSERHLQAQTQGKQSIETEDLASVMTVHDDATAINSVN